MSTIHSHLATVNAWLGPRSKPYDLIRIYAIGAVIAFFFLYFGNIRIENGASDYIELARTILNDDGSLQKHLPNGVWGRDVGMALLWLVSGFPFTHSLTGVIIIQVLMGLMMPLLVYLTLEPWFPRAAYFTALATTLSLAPIILSKFIHHDQAYIFFTLVSVYLFNRYMLTKSAGSLYALATSIFAVGLVRQAGTGLFWLVMPICALRGGKRHYPHFALAAIIFVGASISYSKYRAHMMGDLASFGGVPGFGSQLFFAFYLNSSEFGVKLSPSLGANTKFILDRIHNCSLPSKLLDGPLQAMAVYFNKYTRDELVDKIATQSSSANYQFILASRWCTTDPPAAADRTLLGASLEIARAHPLYVTRLFFRNSFQLLYDPGWVHSQTSFGPETREGLSFPLGGEANMIEDAIDDDRMPKALLAEAHFFPLARQSEFIKGLYFAVYRAWYICYHPVTIILGCLTWFTWISTFIGLLRKLLDIPELKRLSELWLSDEVVPGSIGISMFLIANVAITAIGVEPMYRYDFSLQILKFMLAGVGCVVATKLLMSAWLPVDRSSRISCSRTPANSP